MYCLYNEQRSKRFSCYTDLCPFLKEQVFTSLLWAHLKRSNKATTSTSIITVHGCILLSCKGLEVFVNCCYICYSNWRCHRCDSERMTNDLFWVKFMSGGLCGKLLLFRLESVSEELSTQSVQLKMEILSTTLIITILFGYWSEKYQTLR